MTRQPQPATLEPDPAAEDRAGTLRLIQIHFSHNCLKVRLALACKGVAYELEEIRPVERGSVIEVSGQEFVPVLVAGDRAVADSTAILRHLERIQPDPPLVPADPALRAECWRLAEWADRTFMALSRRIAYRSAFAVPGLVGGLFFPSLSEQERRAREAFVQPVVYARFGIAEDGHEPDLADARAAASDAVRRLADGPYLLGEALTVADIALASMSYPLVRSPELASDLDVAGLLAWGEPIVAMDQLPRARP